MQFAYPIRRCSPDFTVSSTDDKIIALLWGEFTAHRLESVVYSTSDGAADDDNNNNNNRKQSYCNPPLLQNTIVKLQCLSR